ncbi:MAG: TonB family protein [Flavobacteriales bacterium]|nr:TonB family protein [Flavobacteriales bacterium]
MFYLTHVKNSIIAVTLLVAFGLVGCYSARRTKGTAPPLSLFIENFETDSLNPGVKQGKYTSYYKHNKVAEGFYLNGKRSGEWKFYANGEGYKLGEPFAWSEVLSFQGSYNKGKRTGTWEIYPEVNRYKSILHYRNGEPDSSWISYWPNGKIASSRTYVNGVIHGVTYDYFEDGTTEWERNYKNGELHGKVKRYYSTSSLHREMEYRNGNKYNLLSYTDINGDSIYGGNIIEGNGLLITYFEPESEGSELVRFANQEYRDGVLNGEAVYYHSNGNMKSAGHYLEDKKVGIWDYFQKVDGLLYATDTIEKGDEQLAGASRDEGKVYTVVDIMPEFPGGESGMLYFLARNIQYPDSAKENGISGTVFARFMVNSMGEIENIEILKGISADCDAEVIRVVRKMPNWLPGLRKGFPVSVQYNLPVRFVLR